MKIIYEIILMTIYLLFSINNAYANLCTEGSPKQIEQALNRHISVSNWGIWRVYTGKLEMDGYVYWGEPEWEQIQQWRLNDLGTRMVQDYLRGLNSDNKAAIISHTPIKPNGDMTIWFITESSYDCVCVNLKDNEEFISEGTEGVVRKIMKNPLMSASINEIFIPYTFLQKALDNKISTLVIVSPGELTLIPYQYLVVKDTESGNEIFINQHFSVLVSFGFHEFLGSPDIYAKPITSDAVIVGYGKRHPDYSFPPIQGTITEATEISKIVNVPRENLFLNKDALKACVTHNITSNTGLIYLSTHGSYNSRHPLDGSYLLLEDGAWTAREIAQLHDSTQINPSLVVMSACKTVRGKEFPYVMVNLAMAWRHAGAAYIVASPREVSVESTTIFMKEFIQNCIKMRPDRAMQHVLDPVPNALDLQFKVYGVPTNYNFQD